MVFLPLPSASVVFRVELCRPRPLHGTVGETCGEPKDVARDGSSDFSRTLIRGCTKCWCISACRFAHATQIAMSSFLSISGSASDERRESCVPPGLTGSSLAPASTSPPTPPGATEAHEVSDARTARFAFCSRSSIFSVASESRRTFFLTSSTVFWRRSDARGLEARGVGVVATEEAEASSSMVREPSSRLLPIDSAMRRDATFTRLLSGPIDLRVPCEALWARSTAARLRVATSAGSVAARSLPVFSTSTVAGAAAMLVCGSSR